VQIPVVLTRLYEPGTSMGLSREEFFVSGMAAAQFPPVAMQEPATRSSASVAPTKSNGKPVLPEGWEPLASTDMPADDPELSD
jgi:hypothetical protein